MNAGSNERNDRVKTTVRYHPHGKVLRLMNRVAIGAALLLVMLLIGAQLARGA